MLTRNELSAEELVSKGIAPVKKEHIRKSVAPRVHVEAVTSAARGDKNDQSGRKKSKGQQKRVCASPAAAPAAVPSSCSVRT
jgi:hypothetical protein